MIQNFLEHTKAVHSIVKFILNKLHNACYAVRSVKPCTSKEALIMVYYAYFYSIMSCGLICWGNSAHSAPCCKYKKYHENFYRAQK